jgi:hypothetical protein
LFIAAERERNPRICTLRAVCAREVPCCPRSYGGIIGVGARESTETRAERISERRWRDDLQLLPLTPRAAAAVGLV